ncbi:Exosome complex component CSL4 [Cytospora mali]|uniref:Exosome complex component CSL4 n=1 Tax=Cytospora mali TaxID=578113 RepID=A0A194W548_CYTMA|nr:Exosome complex component CSL4 [Valsa mali]
MATTSIAIPGQLLGPASKYKPGPGVHLYESNLYSSVLGTGPAKRISRITQTLASKAGASELPTVSVSREVSGAGGKKQREVLPQVGNIVLCRITRITPRQAVAAILVCGDTVLEAEWQGVIRVQDVRATEKDRVKIYESFRPGDIVRASVISLGDQSNYYLATASNELGVIMAVSEAGNAMYPVSWKEYKDPETGLSESRKVAKPF